MLQSHTNGSITKAVEASITKFLDVLGGRIVYPIIECTRTCHDLCLVKHAYFPKRCCAWAASKLYLRCIARALLMPLAPLPQETFLRALP